MAADPLASRRGEQPLHDTMNPYSDQLLPAEIVGRARLDVYAAGLSVLCLIHCLALPLLVTIMPLAAQVAGSELVHRILVAAAVPISLRAIWKALAAEGNRLFVGAALGGLGLLVIAAFVEAVSAYGQPITVAGGVLLCSAHTWHWVRLRGQVRISDIAIKPNKRRLSSPEMNSGL